MDPQPRSRPLPDTSGDPAFIGRGFAFPMRVDAAGRIALTDGAGDLDCSLRVVLATAPGERVMRPNFGCAIWDLVFEPINDNTLGLMAEVVREAIAMWEPRVTVQEVRTIPADDDQHNALVNIEIDYVVRATNDRRNLVYPFYLIPREEEP